MQNPKSCFILLARHIHRCVTRFQKFEYNDAHAPNVTNENRVCPRAPEKELNAKFYLSSRMLIKSRKMKVENSEQPDWAR